MMFRRCPPGGGQGQKQIVEYLPCLVSNDHWIYHGPQNNDYLNVSVVRPKPYPHLPTAASHTILIHPHIVCAGLFYMVLA